jgi:hypothetical protein
MKNLLIIGIIVLITGAGVFAYIHNANKKKVNDPTTRAVIENEGRELKETSRIKEIESNYDVSVNTTFTILEVDGHLYLSQFRGGIIHMESCPCKNK